MSRSIQYSVYPGQYTPMPEIESLMLALRNRRITSAGHLPLNMVEFDNHYKIDILVPGIKREQIFIYTHDNFLMIAVIPAKASLLPDHKLQVHEFDTEPVERGILLPPNVDAGFIIAEHGHGILRVYIPKTVNPSLIDVSQIAVY